MAIGLLFNTAHRFSVTVSDLRLVEISLLTLICCSSFSLGNLCLSKFDKTHFQNSIIEYSLFCIGIGLGGISLLMLCLGHLGLLYQWIAYLLLFLLLIPSLYSVILNKFFLSYIKSTFQVRFLCHFTDIILSFLVCLILLLSLVIVFVPTLTFDVLVYHLAIPETYLRAHKIIPLPHNFFSNYPLNTEMLFTLGLLLKGDTLAKLIHFLFGLLSALSIYSLARKYLSKEVAWLSILIFTSMPMFPFFSAVAFNDLALVFYEVMAVFAFLNWQESRRHGWLWMSGVFCGLALGVKYLGGFCLLILTLNILWVSRKERMLKNTLFFLVFAILPLLPWLIKNAFFVGNPIYPFLFGGIGWNAFLAERYYQEMNSYNISAPFLLKPFILLADLSLKWTIGERPQIPIGPLFLAYLPFLPLARPINRIVKYLLIFCVLFYLLWAYICAADRFIIPCVTLLCIVVAYIITQLKNKFPRSYYLSLMIIFLTLSFNSYTIAHTIWQNSYFLPLQVSKQLEFLEKKSPYAFREYYSAINFINHHLPQNAKILFIGEVRSYYCQRELLVNTQFDSTIVVDLIRQSVNLDDLLERLKKQNVTHVLYNEGMAQWLEQRFNYFHFQNNNEVNLYHQFMSTALIKIYQIGSISVYEIKGI